MLSPDRKHFANTWKHFCSCQRKIEKSHLPTLYKKEWRDMGLNIAGTYPSTFYLIVYEERVGV